MSYRPHIVITREKKMPGEERLNWEFSHHDFIQKTIEIPAHLDSWDIAPSIVLTSKMGVQAFIEMINCFSLKKSNFSIFCIAGATKDLALRSGLMVTGTASDAQALAHEILKHPTIKIITHVAGNLRRNELAQTLRNAGVEIKELIVYRTELTPILITRPFDGIVFFSPSAVDSFLLKNPVSNAPCFCIGQTTSHYARQKDFGVIYTCEAPTEEAMLSLLNDYFLKSTAHAQK
ncbi:MAG TPA: uroporphyrinogen-III synthase [Cyclobacteriaceae bacterium]|nr:uroporphyrinogen-III synthase [Cyclobacteriaceae bacterium]